MIELRTTLRNDGRIVLPAECRRALQVKSGDELIIRINDGEATIFGMKHAIERAQEIVKKYNRNKKSLVQELINTRRKEAKNE